MIKKIDFKKLFLPMILAAGAITLIGFLMLLIFGGKTFAEYTLNNLRISLFIKALVYFVLFVGLTMLYFLIRFKKKGFWLALYTAAATAINSVSAFFLCVIFRASLGEITFAVILLAVFYTYLTVLVFVSKTADTNNKKTKGAPEFSFEEAAQKTVSTMLIPLIIIAALIVIAFVLALVYSAPMLALYALPMILTTVISVIQTITFTCNLYSKKI